MDSTSWANWAVVGNDAIYAHQIPLVLKELHSRVKQAVYQSNQEAFKIIKGLIEQIETGSPKNDNFYKAKELIENV